MRNISVCDSVVARPDPKMPSARHAKISEDQRIVGDGVERDANQPSDQRWTRSLVGGKDRASGEKQQIRRQAPLIAAHVGSRVARKVYRLAERNKDSLRLRQKDPRDGGKDEGGQKRLVRGASQAFAAFAGADFRSRDGRQRRDDPDAKDHLRLIQIEAERSRRERARREPTQHDEVGRGHRVDCDIGENDRPAERESRANLAREPAAAGRGRDGLRRGEHGERDLLEGKRRVQ